MPDRAIAFRWTGEAMKPLPRFAKACANFVGGHVYRLKEDKERSDESHGFYFACLHTAFETLPEKYADRFASEEHLRKWCLVKCGYRKEHTIVASSESAAQKIAALASVLDEFAVVHVESEIVTVWVAKTQKMKRTSDDGMDKEEFEASKEAVLRECSKLIGVDVTMLLAENAPSPSAREQESEHVA